MKINNHEEWYNAYDEYKALLSILNPIQQETNVRLKKLTEAMSDYNNRFVNGEVSNDYTRV